MARGQAPPALRIDTVVWEREPFISLVPTVSIRVKDAGATDVETNQIESLRGEHRLIEQLAAELAGFIGAPEPPEPVAFLHFRRAFARVLSMHLKREDWVLYPRLRAHARREVRDVADSACSASVALSTAFAAYGRVWTSLAIASDWKGFRAASEAVLASLHDRIAMEENQLYPLLAQDGEARPPSLAILFAARSGIARKPALRAPNAIVPEHRSPRTGGRGMTRMDR